MKENVFEVIIYLFENYINGDSELHTVQDTLTVELRRAGFQHTEINKAFEWLEGLVSLKEKTLPYSEPNKSSIRIFSQQEQNKLDTQCRGYLLLLEQFGIVNEVTRELIIDRCMALETDEFNLDQLKWVVLLVLFNQPDQEKELLWIEDLIMAPAPTVIH